MKTYRSFLMAMLLPMILILADSPARAADQSVPQREVTIQGSQFVRADSRLFVPRGLFMRGINFTDVAAFEKTWGMPPREWLDQLAASGANTLRILPTLTVNGKEVVARPESDPAHAERVTRGLELLLAAAGRKGIQVVIVPTGISWDGSAPYHGNNNRWTGFTFGEFKDWDNHPYNQKNSGPLATPADFLDSAAGQKLFEDRIAFYLRFASHPNLIGIELESHEFDGWGGWMERNKRIQFFIEQVQRIREAGLLTGLKMDNLHHQHTKNLSPPGSFDWQRYKHGDGWSQPVALGTGNRVAGQGNATFQTSAPAWTSRPHLDPLMAAAESRAAPRTTDQEFRMHRALALLLAYTPEINPSGSASVAKQFAQLMAELKSVKMVAERIEASSWREPVESISMFNNMGIQSGNGTRMVAFVEYPAKGYAMTTDLNNNRRTGFEKSPGDPAVPLLYLQGGQPHDVLMVSAASGAIIRQETVSLGDIPILPTPDEPVLIFVSVKEAQP